jgi:hypothetical protein
MKRCVVGLAVVLWVSGVLFAVMNICDLSSPQLRKQTQMVMITEPKPPPPPLP